MPDYAALKNELRGHGHTAIHHRNRGYACWNRQDLHGAVLYLASAQHHEREVERLSADPGVRAAMWADYL
jgi:hypothetical protein